VNRRQACVIVTAAVLALAMLLSAMTPVHASTSITVTVRPLTGSTTMITILDDALVPELKNSVNAALGIPAAEQRLIFAGRQLEDAQTLAAYNIVNGSTIHLVRRTGTSTRTAEPATEAPKPWHQAYGRSESTSDCLLGWYGSWAQWPHGSTGGWTCERTLLP
jgi:Ubiquitin family